MQKNVSTPLFPIYLISSLPFRQSQKAPAPASVSVSISVSASAPLVNDAPTDHRLPRTLTTSHSSTLTCLTCATHLAYTSQIVSKGFTGRHGRAYLVSLLPSNTANPRPKPNASPRPQTLVNTCLGRAADRDLLTGRHVVADLSCTICGTVVGWKYVDAKEPGQKYKVGKFILEKKLVGVGSCWEDGDGEDGERGRVEEGSEGEGDVDEEAGSVHFDSENEDECEDLFAGVWDADVVMKRRSAARAKSWVRRRE